MKRETVLVLLAILILSLPCYAQTSVLADEIAKSERIKAEEGDASEKYLDALDQVVKAAAAVEDFGTAYDYRHVYVEIVGRMYGETSVTYADGLFRLGNIAYEINKDPDASFGLYQRAAQIYESNGTTEVYPYGMTMLLSCRYHLHKNGDLSLSYVKKAIEILRPLVNTEWEGVVVAPEDLALCYYLQGRIYQDLQQDVESALDAYGKCSEVVETCNIADTFYSTPYLFLACEKICEDLEAYDGQLIWANKYEAWTKDYFGECSEEHIDALDGIPLLYFINEDTGNAIVAAKKYLECVKDYLISEGVESPQRDSLYLNGLMKLANLEYLSEDYPGLVESSETLKAIFEDMNLTGSQYYLKYLGYLLHGYFGTGRFDKLIDVWGEYGLSPSKFGQKFSVNLLLKADLLKFLSRFEDAKDVLGKPTNAEVEKKFLLAISENEEIGEFDPHMYNALAAYYSAREMYDKKREVSLAAEKGLRARCDTASYEYMLTLNSLAFAYAMLGEDFMAVATFEKLVGLMDGLGIKNELYELSVERLVIHYAKYGNPEKALTYLDQYEDHVKCVYGNLSEEYAEILFLKSFVSACVQKYDIAEEFELSAIAIKEKIQAPNLFNSYLDLLGLYAAQGNEEKFKTTAETCYQLLQTYPDEDIDWAWAFYYECLGEYYRIKHSGLSKDYFKQAIAYWKNENRRDFMSTMESYMMANYIDGVPDESDLCQLMNEYRDRYVSSIFYLNEGERENYVFGHFHMNDIVFSAPYGNKYFVSLYDYILFNKGLLLNTSISYEKAIRSSGDQSLIDKYDTLLGVNALLKSNRDNAADDVTSLQKQISSLEREISASVKNLPGNIPDIDVTYSDVTNALTDKDVAIEYVVYYDLMEDGGYWKYVALVTRRGWTTPIFVQLGSKSELEQLFDNNPDGLYSEGYVSSELYRLLWAPLEEYVSNGDNVYFAPDGCIYQLAIEQLCDGKGKRLCEKYNMLRCLSTRYVCTSHTENHTGHAVLYGGLTYDEDDETMMSAARNYVSSATDADHQFSYIAIDSARNGWQYLPGTLEEVKGVAKVLDKHDVANHVYSMSQGSEESFKALSGKDISILHLATHGFYVPDTQKDSSSNFRFDFLLSNGMNINTKSVSAMSRTGLLLSGGNRAWLGQDVIDGIEDGVLTANEIVGLDFSSVDLLVLSACETGLGEITSDGVMGLQRAFKSAGVNTIVMSLWNVDDQATSLMMTEFYKSLLAGKPKREAFSHAQAAVRKKYPEPSKWAAFVMVD